MPEVYPARRSKMGAMKLVRGTAAGLAAALAFVAVAARAGVPGAARRAERTEKLREDLRAAPRNFTEFVESLVDSFFEHLPGLISGILIFLVFWLLSRISVRIARNLMRRTRADDEARELLLPVLRFGVLTVGVLMALDQMGFEVGSLLAGVGIAGLAIGLAAQETLGNLFAGFLILWDRPFRLGDIVTVATMQGEVTEIGLTSIRLKTFEGREVVLPTKEVIRQALVNHSRFPEIRLSARVMIADSASVEPARAAILAALANETWILAKPAPMVVATSLTELGVGLEARAWIHPPEAPDRSTARVLEISLAALAGAGIEVARPVRMRMDAAERT
jgi:small conductance mechanosensitive channel